MYEIKHIDPVSLGKTLAAIAGSIFFACFALFMMLMMGIGEIDLEDLFFDDDFIGVLGVGLGVSVIGFFVGGILGAFVYNKFAERFGGIKLDIAYYGQNEKVQTKQEKDV